MKRRPPPKNGHPFPSRQRSPLQQRFASPLGHLKNRQELRHGSSDMTPKTSNRRGRLEEISVPSAAVTPPTTTTTSASCEESPSTAVPGFIVMRKTIASSSPQLDIYERSKLHLAKRERKLRALREKLMEECTFHPNLQQQQQQQQPNRRGRSLSPLPRRNPLHQRQQQRPPRSRNASLSKSPPDLCGPPLRSPRDNKDSPTSEWSLGSRGMPSRRIEDLYQEGIRRVRNQRAHENNWKRRREEEELKECTFRPRAGAAAAPSSSHAAASWSSRQESSWRSIESLSQDSPQPIPRVIYTGSWTTDDTEYGSI